MRIILHIGHPKCGSSTIQKFFANNWKELEQQHIGYIDANFELFSREASPKTLVEYFRKIKEGSLSKATLKTDLEQVLIQAEQKSLNTIVISAENLADIYFSDLLGPLIASQDIEILYYVRKPDDWLISAWKQWGFKQGINLENYIDRNIASRRTLFRNVIEAYLAAFPDAKFHVNLISKAFLHDGDLLSDVNHSLKIDTSNLHSVRNSNESLDIDILEALSGVPSLFDSPHDNRLVNQLRKHLDPQTDKKGNLPIGIGKIRKIYSCYEEEWAWLSHKFFNDELPALTANNLNGRYQEPDSDPDLSRILKMQGLQLQLLMKLLEKS